MRYGTIAFDKILLRKLKRILLRVPKNNNLCFRNFWEKNRFLAEDVHSYTELQCLGRFSAVQFFGLVSSGISPAKIVS